jgi:glycerophosphoryl diester phosphodiesterase
MFTPRGNVVVVAHRGMAAGFPENTLAAYRNAASLGFSAIEIDLRATADGHIVIMHDDTVDRTTNGSGRVDQMTLAEIKSLDAGSYIDPKFADLRVPTYQEVLEALRGSGVRLVLDIKEDDALDDERVVRLTERYGAIHDVLVGPRSVAGLQRFRELNPALKTLGLVPGPEFQPPDPNAIEQFALAGADLIRLWPSWIFSDRGPGAGNGNSKLIERLHDLGKPVWTTADTLYHDIDPSHPREDLQELVRLGVNGIITDLPELCRDVLSA